MCEPLNPFEETSMSHWKNKLPGLTTLAATAALTLASGGAIFLMGGDDLTGAIDCL